MLSESYKKRLQELSGIVPNTQKEYYTTSYPINIKQFVETEVNERGNYTRKEVKEWIKKYNIKTDTQLLWVTTTPWMAARYQMSTDDWNNDIEQIYKSNPENYNVRTISSLEGTIIDETEDGDDGYILVLNK